MFVRHDLLTRREALPVYRTYPADRSSRTSCSALTPLPAARAHSIGGYPLPGPGKRPVEQIAQGGSDIARARYKLAGIGCIVRQQPAMKRAHLKRDDIWIQMMNMMIVKVELTDEDEFADDLYSSWSPRRRMLRRSRRTCSENDRIGSRNASITRGRQSYGDAAGERFFISQFDFHYHHVHHLYPNVVTFKVRALHRWLLANDAAYPGQFITRPGYVGTALRYLFDRPFAGAGSGYPAYRCARARQAAE